MRPYLLRLLATYGPVPVQSADLFHPKAPAAHLSRSRCAFLLENTPPTDSHGLRFRSVLALRRLRTNRRRGWQPTFRDFAPKTADHGPLCEKCGLAPWLFSLFSRSGGGRWEKRAGV